MLNLLVHIMTTKQTDITQRARNFIITHRAASLATVDKDGVPQVVYVYCLVDDDLALYFMTRVESRKFENIVNQPKVGMSFVSEKTMEAIHLTGVAERVNDLESEQSIWFELMKLRSPDTANEPVPVVQMFERGATGEVAIIKVTPYEMTFATYQKAKEGHYIDFWQKVI